MRPGASALAFAVAVALYLGTLGHGFVFDDHALVEKSAFSTPYRGPERNDGWETR